MDVPGIAVRTYEEFPGERPPVLWMIGEAGAQRMAVDTLGAELLAPAQAMLERLDLVDHAKPERAVKGEAELGLIREAARFADLVLERLLAAGGDIIQQSGTEDDLMADCTEHVRAMLSETHGEAFLGTKMGITASVHSGPRAALPHGSVTTRTPLPGEPIVAGIGCSLGGYHAESGVTLVLGDIQPEQLRVMEAMAEAGAATVHGLESGWPCARVNEAALAAIRDAGLGDAIRHRIGHGMGVEGHEAPWLAPGDPTPTAPGMVFSCEPGVYRPRPGRMAYHRYPGHRSGRGGPGEPLPDTPPSRNTHSSLLRKLSARTNHLLQATRMPEPAAWRYQKITKPMFDLPTPHLVLTGRVLTMAGDVIEEGFVELRDGEIAAMGPRTELKADSAPVEETGGTLMPGLINSHAHLNWDGIHDLARQSMDDPQPISAFKAAGNMLKSLRAGVTMVRDLGFHEMNLFSKQAVEQGIFPGPRLKVCGAAIIQTGGHTYWVCKEASGADEMRRAVREQVKGGADLIKIMACHDTLEFTDEELHAVIDEAHRNGLPITAHATYDACIERVARFGVDCIEHGGSMSDATVALLVEKEIPVVTTFAPLVQQSQPEIARRFGIPEWKIEERQKAVANPDRYEGLVKAARAGVSIVFGTDAGSPAVEHDVIAPELAHMVKVGVCSDNMDALASITIRAARLSKMDHLVSTLEVGKAADLIVVDGRPDEDLGALENVTTTFVGGRRMHG